MSMFNFDLLLLIFDLLDILKSSIFENVVNALF